MVRRARFVLIMLLLVGVMTITAPSSTTSPLTAASAEGGSRTNVLFFLMDDMRADELKYMPNVRKLIGNQGVTFDNAISSNSICCPARTTLMTGQYSHNNNVWGNVSSLRGGYYWYKKHSNPRNTLPVWLRKAGYKTGITGKFLNRYGDRNLTEVPPGWSEWNVPPGSQAYTFRNQTVNENGRLVKFNGHATTLAKTYTHQMIDGFGSSPWFIQTNFLAPHDQWRVNKGWGPPLPLRVDRNRPVSPLRVVLERDVSDKPGFVRRLPRFGSGWVAKRTARIYRARARSLMGVDRAIGRTISKLEKQGVLENTLIIFSSDNGYMAGEHNIPDGKSYQYEESVHVPLLMRGPGITAGSHITALVGLQDIVPTILQVAGAKAGRVQDGVSLYEVMANESGFANRPMLYEISNVLGHGLFDLGKSRFGTSFYKAIRTPKWVYIRHITGDRELYNLNRDPHQLRNLARLSRFAKVRKRLASRLSTLERCKGGDCNKEFVP